MPAVSEYAVFLEASLHLSNVHGTEQTFIFFTLYFDIIRMLCRIGVTYLYVLWLLYLTIIYYLFYSTLLQKNKCQCEKYLTLLLKNFTQVQFL